MQIHQSVGMYKMDFMDVKSIYTLNNFQFVKVTIYLLDDYKCKYYNYEKFLKISTF